MPAQAIKSKKTSPKRYQKKPAKGKVAATKENDSPPAAANKGADIVKIHPIMEVIGSLKNKVKDTIECIPYGALATEKKKASLASLQKQLVESHKRMKLDDEIARTAGVAGFLDTIRLFDREMSSNSKETILNGLFLGLFTAFDAFTGDLISALFSLKPELYAGLNSTVLMSEVITASSIESLKARFLDEEIESMRRKSYAEQFQYMEKKFDLPLRKFERWSDFIECAQRRNIITHCNGVVSDQYLKQCTENGHSPAIKKGARASVSAEYLSKSCELISEISIKLAITLWKKVLPHESAQAERELNNLCFEFLTDKMWNTAKIIGLFLCEQKKFQSEEIRLISVINLAIAHDNLGENELRETLLSSVDWSACCLDLKLAVEILRGNYQKAGVVMGIIGKSGAYFNKQAYVNWPLFEKFRSTKYFLDQYREIYGHPFEEVLTLLGRQAVKDTAALKEREGK